jgi:hypothetical protein
MKRKKEPYYLFRRRTFEKASTRGANSWVASMTATAHAAGQAKRRAGATRGSPPWERHLKAINVARWAREICLLGRAHPVATEVRSRRAHAGGKRSEVVRERGGHRRSS